MRLAAGLQRRLGLGQDPADTGVTMGEWLDGWLAGKRRSRRASTYRSYETHVRVHIRPAIGGVPLERMNTGHVEQVAVQAGVPPIKLHEANSLMRDAGVDQELRMQIVGHSDRDINSRYTHTLAEAHRAAAEQTAAYVLGKDGAL